ncbi:ectoine hydroxylase [Streptomyces sp. UMAF16]|uniref:ectoine hydroxylase n=1 Tax=Streptomyces achromogenes TaxID=67255 RepID=UPI0022835A3C|nr:ectoine hydroxylase [Streptomyces sp. UMAF16]
MNTTVRPDLYPTRVSGEAVPQPRVDPVVWGDAPGPLDEEQLARYRSSGYLVLDHLLSPREVEAYRAELRRLGSDPALRASERVILEPGSDRVRSVFEVEKVSELFAGLLHSPRLTDIARQVLGSDVYIHQSRVNYKPGFGGAPFDWHSDFETWHSEDGMPRPRAFSVSIALSENLPCNGPLMVMPGTHTTFVPTVGETPPDYHKESLRVERLPVGSPDPHHLTRMAEQHGIEQVTGPAGTAVMFDSNLLHASSGNITPFPRSNIFIVYNSVENTLEAPFAAARPRPQHLGNREFPV